MSGLRALAEATGNAAYDELPEGAKASTSYLEWLWLSDAQKAKFVQALTEPESFDDGC